MCMYTCISTPDTKLSVRNLTSFWKGGRRMTLLPCKVQDGYLKRFSSITNHAQKHVQARLKKLEHCRRLNSLQSIDGLQNHWTTKSEAKQDNVSLKLKLPALKLLIQYVIIGPNVLQLFEMIRYSYFFDRPQHNLQFDKIDVYYFP